MSRNFAHAVFTAWGNWHIRNTAECPGWDNRNILAKWTDAGRGGVPGHRILCREMPPDVRRVERGVAKLSPKLREAVFLRYCDPVIINGKPAKNGDLAAIAGCSYETFRKRVRRALSDVIRSEFRPKP